MVPTIHTLPNGRRYRLVDQGPYVGGEYPKGGISISAWEPRLGRWVWVDQSPDAECAAGFLRAAGRLPPIPG